MLRPFTITSTASIIPPELTEKYLPTTTTIPPSTDTPTVGEVCDPRVLNKRTDRDLSATTASIIRSVTAHIETLPVGTFKYKVFQYPSDIDIFEKLEGCCTLNAAKLDAANLIQSIVKNIINNPDLIFTEFKAGYDNRFKIYTGVINSAIEDYHPDLIRRDINNLYEAKWLTCAEHQELLSLVKEIPDINDIIALNERLRDFWVVRWNANEILQGYKVLPGDYKLYLDVALAQGSVVKLDTIAKILGAIPEQSRYVEVTNFFLITQRDRFGNVITLSEELGDYAQSLLEDVYKYYPDNVLKSIKRLWMYLAFKGEICELGLFTELFSSDVALFSQIIGDLDVAIMLLQSRLSYDRNFLYSSLQRRLALLGGVCMNTGPVAPKAQILSERTPLTPENLAQIRSCLMDTINTRAQQWLQEHNIDILALAQI